MRVPREGEWWLVAWPAGGDGFRCCPAQCRRSQKHRRRLTWHQNISSMHNWAYDEDDLWEEAREVGLRLIIIPTPQCFVPSREDMFAVTLAQAGV